MSLPDIIGIEILTKNVKFVGFMPDSGVSRDASGTAVRLCILFLRASIYELQFALRS